MEGIYAHADLLKVYKAILDATQEIGIYLRYHSGKSIALDQAFQAKGTHESIL